MAWALHGALVDLGVDSIFLTQEPGVPPGATGCLPTRGGPLYHARRRLDHARRHLDHARRRLDHAKRRMDRVLLAAYPRRTREPFSPALVPGGILGEVRRLAPDVVHLHWLGGGFLSIGEVARLPGPVVWTLHDLWPFTGGCHYPGQCPRFAGRCGRCPLLGSTWGLDLSFLGQRRKRAYASRADLFPVGISRWMVGMAQRSALFREREVAWIPNGVDRGVFSPGDRLASREALGWPAQDRVVLFGAVSPLGERRKGGDLLWQALATLAADPGRSAFRCVVFGGAGTDAPPAVGAPVELVGAITDPNRLALLYRAADVVVVPSIQEGFGLVTAEALASGARVVAFRGTGADDLVEHGVSGYLAQAQSVPDLVRGLGWALGEGDPPDQDTVEPGRVAPIGLPEVAARYVALYERAMAGNNEV